MMLNLGLPSKGRIQDQAFDFLARAGLEVRRTNGRSYTVSIKGADDIKVWLLPSGEIAKRLIDGRLHAGITGQDLLSESGGSEQTVQTLRELGFARADLVVAVPRAWVDVVRTSDLLDVFDDIREREARSALVATKYMNITRRAFSGWGLKDYRLVADPGATEAAPARGIADLIVDITTSGETLRANALKPVPDPIMSSQAVLAGSLAVPEWSDTALDALGDMIARMVSEADPRKLLRFKAPDATHELATILEAQHGVKLGEVQTGGLVDVLVEPGKAFGVAATIKDHIDGAVTLSRPDQILDGTDANWVRFRDRIKAGAN